MMCMPQHTGSAKTGTLCVTQEINDIFKYLHSVCPIFCVSNVTGQNLELITKFLNAVPKQILHEKLEQQETEFQIDELYSVPEVGVVVGGTLTR